MNLDRAGDIYGLPYGDRLMLWVRVGKPDKARQTAEAMPTVDLYTLRRDLLQMVEVITDETERRHKSGDPGPEPGEAGVR